MTGEANVGNFLEGIPLGDLGKLGGWGVAFAVVLFIVRQFVAEKIVPRTSLDRLQEAHNKAIVQLNEAQDKAIVQLIAANGRALDEAVRREGEWRDAYRVQQEQNGVQAQQINALVESFETVESVIRALPHNRPGGRQR